MSGGHQQGGGFKKKQHAAEEGTDAWLMTYADMITLLLCFFVILLSVSEPKKEKFEQLKQSMMAGFVQNLIETPFEQSYTEMMRMIDEDDVVAQNLAVEKIADGLTLNIASEYLFTPGTADLNAEALPLLDSISRIIIEKKLPDYEVEVQGHTDDTPLDSATIPSNWELSALQAAIVTRYLIEKKIPAERIRASGYAETRPSVPNIDAASGKPIPENREKNRRVVVKILRKG